MSTYQLSMRAESETETSVYNLPVGRYDNNPENKNLQDDLAKVKELSHKLQLEIKRRSILQWKLIIEEKKKKGLLGTITPSNSAYASPAKETYKQNQPSELHFPPKIYVTHESSDDLSATKSKDGNHNLSKLKTPTSQNSSNGKTPQKLPPIQTQQDDCSPCKRKETESHRKITEALVNIRKDLILMRMEDHALARKLLNIREDINRQKATLLCEEHAKLLDCVSWEIEEEKELDELHKLSDLSSALLRKEDSLLRSPSLLHKMRINKTTFDMKRFSVI